MNYGTIKTYDTGNGEGIRISLFVSGCRHKCKGCFNSIAWDFNFGKKYSKENENFIINELSKEVYSGLTILGGEPLEPENQKEISELIKKVKENLPGKTIWLYSGFTFEEILEKSKNKKDFPYLNDIINNIDILVDGKFILKLKNLSLRFKGSSNQRIIDVKNTLKEGKIIKKIE